VEKHSAVQKTALENRKVLGQRTQEIFPYSYSILSRFYDRFRIDVIRSIVANNTSKRIVVDVGCADGFLLFSISGKQFLGVGVDFVRNIIRKANESAEILNLKRNREFLLCSAEELCLKNESVDIVICAEVLEHLPNPLKAIKESERILKKERTLILSIPAVPFIKLFASSFFKTRIRYRSPQHLREYAYRKHGEVQGLDELIAELHKMNFRVTEIRNIGVFYLLISRFAQIKPLARFFEVFELKLSKKIPLSLSGIFFIIEAVKK